jgi:hypothetical protein
MDEVATSFSHAPYEGYDGQAGDGGYIKELIWRLPDGGVPKFLADVHDAATACNVALNPKGAVFSGGVWTALPRDAPVYSVELFSCCRTLAPGEIAHPHDVVYLHAGNLIAAVFSRSGAFTEAAVAAEHKLQELSRSDVP